MTTMSQRNKKITTRKIPATDIKVLVRTGSLRFFKKCRQPIIKFWSVPVPVRETVRSLKQIILSSRLYVLVMSRTRFRVNPHSIVAWMSRNSLLQASARNVKFKWLHLDSTPVWPNGWVFVYEVSGSGFESSCSHLNFLPDLNYTFISAVIS